MKIETLQVTEETEITDKFRRVHGRRTYAEELIKADLHQVVNSKNANLVHDLQLNGLFYLKHNDSRALAFLQLANSIADSADAIRQKTDSYGLGTGEYYPVTQQPADGRSRDGCLFLPFALLTNLLKI